MSKITYDRLCKKCGFDIRTGYEIRHDKTYTCDDSTPSPWSVFTQEEKDWIRDNVFRKDISDSTG